MRIPEHIAITMDGNRRWAKKRGLPAIIGHAQGSVALQNIVESAAKFGVKTLTTYAFSTENWFREKGEVAALLKLFKKNLIDLRAKMVEQDVRFETIGNLSRFPEDLFDEIQKTKELTKGGKKIELVLALNYGGRDEICRAAKALIDEHSRGAIKDLNLTESLFASYLDTSKWKDPELFIRTGGENRLSNFLLWQLSYAEVYITKVLWPDFDEKELHRAIEDYQSRDRRCGK